MSVILGCSHTQEQMNGMDISILSLLFQLDQPAYAEGLEGTLSVGGAMKRGSLLGYAKLKYKGRRAIFLLLPDSHCRCSVKYMMAPTSYQMDASAALMLKEGRV